MAPSECSQPVDHHSLHPLGDSKVLPYLRSSPGFLGAVMLIISLRACWHFLVDPIFEKSKKSTDGSLSTGGSWDPPRGLPSRAENPTGGRRWRPGRGELSWSCWRIRWRNCGWQRRWGSREAAPGEAAARGWPLEDAMGPEPGPSGRGRP